MADQICRGLSSPMGHLPGSRKKILIFYGLVQSAEQSLLSICWERFVTEKANPAYRYWKLSSNALRDVSFEKLLRREDSLWGSSLSFSIILSLYAEACSNEKQILQASELKHSSKTFVRSQKLGGEVMHPILYIAKRKGLSTTDDYVHLVKNQF